MSHHIIDRRGNAKKSSGNRQRFIRRVKQQVKDAAADIIRDGKVESITDTKTARSQFLRRISRNIRSHTIRVVSVILFIPAIRNLFKAIVFLDHRVVVRAAVVKKDHKMVMAKTASHSSLLLTNSSICFLRIWSFQT